MHETPSFSAPVQLRKILRGHDVLGLAFGAMIGWGWVVLAREMIDRAGTLGSALAFVVGAVMVLLVGLTYAELTSALSRAGGELSFTYLGLGPKASYFCGWSLVLAYLAVCAFEAVALPTVVGYVFEDFDKGYLYTVARRRAIPTTASTTSPPPPQRCAEYNTCRHSR